jgi:hypothetical protein
MAKTTINIEIPDKGENENAAVKTALTSMAEKLSAKELIRLRQIVLYEPSLLAAARKYLRL